MITVNRSLLSDMKYIFLIVLMLSAFAQLSFAAGRTCFPVLMELTDPRALALGGALITENGWSEGALLNPASAAGSQRMIGISYASHMVDMWSGRLTLSELIKGKYTVGGYITTFDYGDFEASETGVGATDETFRAGEYVFVGYGAGRFNKNFAWGGAVKFIWGTIDPYDASGMAVDIGMTYDPNWQDLKLGGVLRNWGKQFSSYGKETDPLPTELTLGVSSKLKHLPLTLSTALIFTRESEGEWEVEFLPGNPGLSFGIGGEFEVYSELLDDSIQLRIGYRSRGEGLRVGQQNDLLAGTSLGIGIPIRKYKFEYAYATMGALGSIHRFGISGAL